MLVYNILSDLTSAQFLVFLCLEALFVAIAFLVFKRKPSLKVISCAIVIAFVLALLSTLIGNGFYGGMMYHERLGWPFPFLSISRNIEVGSRPGVPFAFQFDWLKFFAITVFWGFLPIAVMFNLTPNKRFRNFTLIFLVVFIALTLIFCLSNSVSSSESDFPTIPEASIPSVETPDPKTVKIMRGLIEKTFPEFSDFENQPSFAGKSVKVSLDEGEYYFAYLTHGSGLPIVKATCFRVDWQTAYKIGEFPNPLDSYLGYSDINPQTCKGVH